jgi:prepilin-type N-terminal cleavage/methylation domain-containing protein
MKRRNAGFSLVEVVVALGIFGVAGVALIGILGTGITLSKGALSDAETAMMLENVQARLTLDPAWPGKRDAVFYDNSGAQMKKEEQASLRVEMTLVNGPGFASDYLDTYRARITRLPHGEEVGIWTLQRVRLARGKPVKAE